MKTNIAGMSILLLLLICSFSLVSAAEGDLVGPNGLVAAYKPYIVFPQNNHAYNSDSLMLNVSFKAMAYANMNYSATYSLDGQANEYFPVVKHYLGNWVIYHGENDYVDGSVRLPALSEGSHSLILFLTLDWEIGYQNGTTVYTYYDTETVNFTVGQNQTPQLPVTESLSETPPIENATEPLNTTPSITEPSLTPQQKVEPNQTDDTAPLAPEHLLVMMTFIVLAIATIVVACLLAHFRKHRRK